MKCHGRPELGSYGSAELRPVARWREGFPEKLLSEQASNKAGEGEQQRGRGEGARYEAEELFADTNLR